MEYHIIDGTFQIGLQIGFGECGTAYNAINMDTELKVAAKFEEYTSNNVRVEWDAYKALSGIKGIPKVYHYSADHCGQNVLIMERFEKSLEDLFAEQKKFSLPLAISLAKQLQSTLRDIHSAGYIHCDLKPANILLRGDEIFIADFGLASFYTKDQCQGTLVKWLRRQEEFEMSGSILHLLRGEYSQTRLLRSSV